MADDSLQVLADKLAIRELTARYNRGFDDNEPDAFAATFTEDGALEIVGGMTISGTDGLREMARSTGWGVVHLTTDSIIEVDGDRATQDCYLIVVNRTKEPPSSSFGNTGRYRDTLVRTPGGWKFQKRSVTLDAEI